MFSNNIVAENGDSFIPPSQRPDGTWRKARRVKEGYVPQEEVPLYESKGKQFAVRREAGNVALPGGQVGHRPIPGLFIAEEKDKKETSGKKKKKCKSVEVVTKQLAAVTVSEKKEESTDPAKKLKNLKKRLREVEALEEKIKNKSVEKPEAEQLAKIQRKSDLILQIDQLEKSLP